jgi:hypothetical protein
MSGQTWEKWARRLFSIASTSLGAAKSDNDIRLYLEEVVLGASGAKDKIAWRLESLRQQKLALLAHIRFDRANIRSLSSVLPILRILIAITRMQKMSGHLHTIPHFIGPLATALGDLSVKSKRWSIIPEVTLVQ